MEALPLIRVFMASALTRLWCVLHLQIARFLLAFLPQWSQGLPLRARSQDFWQMEHAVMWGANRATLLLLGLPRTRA